MEEYKFLRHFSSVARAHAAALTYKPKRILWKSVDKVVPRCNGLCPIGAMIQIDYAEEVAAFVGDREAFKSPDPMSASHFLRSSCDKDVDGDDYFTMKDFMWLFDNSKEFNYSSSF